MISINFKGLNEVDNISYLTVNGFIRKYRKNKKHVPSDIIYLCLLFYYDPLDSVILTDLNEIHQLQQLLLSKLPNYKELILLFRSTRDGDDPQIFHDKCDNKGATLVLVHTEYNHIFCGYTSKSWTASHSSWKSDKNAFLCLIRSSFDHDPKIYNIKNAEQIKYGTWHYSDWGPCFGYGCDIAVPSNTTNQTDQCNSC